MLLENGGTEEQAELLNELGALRHNFHSQNLRVLASAEDDSAYRYFDNDITGDNAITERLERENLPRLDLPTRPLYNLGDENEEEYEITEEEILKEWSKWKEKVNEKIEYYLEKIDEKYKTKYKPTGALRQLFQKADNTNTEAFKKWFSDSKVVDENGKPLVVYHNTSQDFDTFDLTQARQSSEIPAFFFTADSAEYTDMGDRQIAAYLNIRNPYRQNYITYKGITGGTTDTAFKEIREALIADGYDGVISDEEYIAFYSNQIKSVDNKGSFDPENPNIYYQTGYRGVTGKKFMSRAGYAMFTYDKEKALYYTGSNNDKSGALLKIDDMVGNSIDIAELQQEISDKWEKQKEDDELDFFIDRDSYEYDLSGADVAELFNLKDIVESAAGFDDEAMTSWLWQNVLEEKNIDIIRTNDGFIVFNEDLIERMSDEEAGFKQYYDRKNLTYYQTAEREISDTIDKVNERAVKEYTTSSKTKAEVKNIFKEAGVIKNIDIGNTKFPAKSAGKLLRHKGFDIGAIAEHLPEIYKDSLLINSLPEQEYGVEHKPHNNIALWHNLLNKFKVNGEEYYIRFTVQEMKTRQKIEGGEKFLHSAFVSDIKLYKTKTGEALDSRNNLRRTLTPVDNILADIFVNVNSSNKQDVDNKPLGSFTATDFGFLIKLFENANDSTIIHEQLGHAYQQMLEMIQNETPVDERSVDFQAMIEGLNSWLGVKADNDGKITYTREQKEKFAKGAVTYIKEGKFPDAQTETLFTQFKRWIADIWEWLVNNGMTENINDNVRRSFDYLLESEQAYKTYFQTGNIEKAKDTLDKIKNSEVKDLTQDQLTQAKDTLRQFKAKRIARPSGTALTRRLEKYGIKEDSGDAGVIKGDNKRIKLYKRGDKGYNAALNIGNFINEGQGNNDYTQYNGQGFNEEAAQELENKLIEAAQRKPVYTVEEQERLTKYEAEKQSLTQRWKL